MTAFEIVTSPELIDTNERAAFGVLYQSGRDTAVCAKMIREDIARAQREGAFRGLKVSVSISRYAGGSRVSVKVRRTDGGTVLNPANVTRGALNLDTCRVERYVPRIERALRWLEMLVDLYRRDDSDAQSDYYSVNFSTSITVDRDAEHSEYAAALRAAQVRALRATLASIEDAGGLDDDRPELALAALERDAIAEADALAEALAVDRPKGLLYDLACAIRATASDGAWHYGATMERVEHLAGVLVSVAPALWTPAAAKHRLTMVAAAA